MKILTDKTTALIHDSIYAAAAETALHRGQVVVLSGNSVTPAATQQSGAILGICLENLEAAHSSDARIRVADSPSTVFTCDAPEITATSGTTDTVSANTLAVFADDAFNEGTIKLTKLGAASTNTGKPGDVYTITDFNGTSKTFTLGTTLAGAITAGDVYQVFPPIGTSLGALNTARDSIVLTTAANDFVLRVVGWDTQAGKLLLMANRHIYGSKNV